MFENLTEKLTSVLNVLGNKGRLTEKDVDEALREVRLALLDADVNFKVARKFIAAVKEKVMEDDEILQSLTAGQHVVKVTNDVITSMDSAYCTGQALTCSKQMPIGELGPVFQARLQ